MDTLVPGHLCDVKKNGWYTAGIAVGTVGSLIAPAGALIKGAYTIFKGARAAYATLRSGGAAAVNLLRKKKGFGFGKSLPMNMDCVREIACKYGIDISDLKFKIDKGEARFAGATAPNQITTLARPAFRNEEQLARTLVHERFHVEQLRSGMGYPRTYDAENAWETAARLHEDQWWETIGRGLQ